MILPQTQSLLYGFDGSEARLPGTVTFPVRADPYNIVTEFRVLDVKSSYNAIPREAMDSHDEGSLIHPSSTPEVPHTVGNGRHKG